MNQEGAQKKQDQKGGQTGWDSPPTGNLGRSKKGLGCLDTCDEKKENRGVEENQVARKSQRDGGLNKKNKGLNHRSD